MEFKFHYKHSVIKLKPISDRKESCHSINTSGLGQPHESWLKKKKVPYMKIINRKSKNEEQSIYHLIKW